MTIQMSVGGPAIQCIPRKLFRCKTPTDALCSCGKVHRKLVRAGIEVDVERVSLLPLQLNEQMMALTGQAHVPVLVTDDGEAIYPRRRTSPASAPARSVPHQRLSTRARPSGNSCDAAC